LQDHGFAWTYIYGFVHPYSGRSDLLRLDTVDVEFFSAALALFKASVDPADERLLVLVVGRQRQLAPQPSGRGSKRCSTRVQLAVYPGADAR